MRPLPPLALLPALWALALLAPSPAGTAVPFPTCAEAGCADPGDFGSYLFLPPGRVPNDYDPGARGSWKYEPGSGMDVPGAWRLTTGRPDVVVAILDSGIRWGAADVVRKVALNAGELPPPPGCAAHDCNGDGFVSVDDYAAVPDANGNGFVDGQDLIRTYSDGVDDDGNGFVDDIAGWDFTDDDNDPADDVDYGHGTGQAIDSVAEADNGGGLPGVAPSALFLPLRVGDSFVAVGTDFAQAVVYAVDREVAVIQEALGTVSASAASQRAIDYAYRRGIPVMASAADESSRHHNFPAVLEHTVWLNSVVHGDGTLVQQTDVYDLMNGCTNYGGRAWVAIPSNSCSSEATGRGAGLAVLLVSHGKNLVDKGLLTPYPGTGTPFSAEEVRQLFRRAARDVDHEADRFDLTADPLLSFFLSAPGLGLLFESVRFPTQAGWDQYTGYGRPDAVALLDVREGRIPPEADLSGNVRWFDILDPARTPRLAVKGNAAAVRVGGFEAMLEVGCGVQPKTWSELGRRRGEERLSEAVLGEWDLAATAAACGFDPATPPDDPDAHTVTLRLRVVDDLGNLGEDRRTVALHTDPTLRFAPLHLGASAEGAPTLVDVDRDGVLDVVQGTTDGAVRVLRGKDGAPLDGFPATTDPLPVHPSPAWGSQVPRPHEAVIAPTAADDLDGDGRVEIVAVSAEGRLYVFDDHGRRRPGFPVATDPAFSDPAQRDRLNDTDPGAFAAPTLVDLDPPGAHPALEIVQAALDGHLYAWRADGTPVPGFPVRIADRAKVAIDPATGKATPLVPGVRERGAKIVGSPAVGDLDGDGRAEILVASNEEYEGEPQAFAVESPLLFLLSQLADQLGDAFAFDTAGRLYAVSPDGTAAAGGPFLPGWPVRVPILSPGVLPTVGTGVTGAPTLADVDGSGSLTAAVFGAVGPALLFRGDGMPALGLVGGLPRTLAADFPAGFPAVPSSAGSPDAPFFPALGSGAFGDLTGDGRPEYVAPTGGLRKLLDVSGPALQRFGDHQITAWDPASGALLPAFPRVMDDTQFLYNPTLADVDGDGVAEIVQGSGGYLVRAYRADGSVPAGFPKFTHGWVIASPAAGDVDGDGRVEIVVGTREGNLFVWDTPAPATASALPWPGFGRDRRNTQNLASGVSPLAPPPPSLAALEWELEAIRMALLAQAEESDRGSARRLRQAAATLERALAALGEGDVRRATNGLAPALRQLLHPRANAFDLAERLFHAARAAATRSVAASFCHVEDRRCRRDRDRAEELLEQGERLRRRGALVGALRSYTQAIGRAPGTSV